MRSGWGALREATASPDLKIDNGEVGLAHKDRKQITQLAKNSGVVFVFAKFFRKRRWLRTQYSIRLPRKETREALARIKTGVESI